MLLLHLYAHACNTRYVFHIFILIFYMFSTFFKARENRCVYIYTCLCVQDTVYFLVKKLEKE